MLFALRWRPEARLLLASALVPSTPATYEQLVVITALFAVGKGVRFRTALTLALLSDLTILAWAPAQDVPSPGTPGVGTWP